MRRGMCTAVVEHLDQQCAHGNYSLNFWPVAPRAKIQHQNELGEALGIREDLALIQRRDLYGARSK